MESPAHTAIAIVGVGAVLPDAPDVATFWENLKSGRYSISEVPENRWKASLYFDPDPKARDKTYTTIGGWVREWEWDPLKWKLPLPPKVSDAMDYTQIWALVATRQALMDYGFPENNLNSDRTAVIFGNAMAGDRHYLTALRINFPEYASALEDSEAFQALDASRRSQILEDLSEQIDRRLPPVTEDTMPGELANIIAGRVANLFNFHGPNYSVDAACASAMAAMTAAIEGLQQNDYDAVITGGIDANMSASTFTKFCKIGALSATGTRPFGNGADGFVMGEGAAVFVLKRLTDAEEAGDKIYAVIRGIGGSSDGKGKGITAPNPIGQRFAVERGWARAGLVPDEATMIEAHGTSTKVGDVIEFDSLAEVFGKFDLPKNAIPIGSVKSNIGHLKGAAGAAGMLKAALCLHNKTLVPSLHASDPNPNVDISNSPFFVNQELRNWNVPAGKIRRAGVSAFGFGGTNFHVVLEEHIPGRLLHQTVSERKEVARSASLRGTASVKTPLRGMLFLHAASEKDLFSQLEHAKSRLKAGWKPDRTPPSTAFLSAAHRLVIDYLDEEELAAKIDQALQAAKSNQPIAWRLLRPRGIAKASGPKPKVAFLFTGQGSQYANMLHVLRDRESVVRSVFDEADQVMEPILNGKLSDIIFVDPQDKEAMAASENTLQQTEITQPSILATDYALSRLFESYGIKPDMVMGHSLGEYAALIAAGSLTFPNALRAVSVRAHAMKDVAMEDNGKMAAVFAPLDDVKRILEDIDGYVVIANYNSNGQAVIGGETPAVELAVKKCTENDITAALLPVSHAFHTRIVAPASDSFRKFLAGLEIQPPSLPVISNVTGEFYPDADVLEKEMVDILASQLASPVQFVTGLKTLYDAGVRVFVEVGPKRALAGFVENVFERDLEVIALYANHPKIGDIASFNQALCGLYAHGFGVGIEPSIFVAETNDVSQPEAPKTKPASVPPAVDTVQSADPHLSSYEPAPKTSNRGDDRVRALGQLFVDFLEKGRAIYEGSDSTTTRSVPHAVISGASLGLPGREHIFDDEHIARILAGEKFIDAIPMHIRQAMVQKNITRLVKEKDTDPRFEVISSASEVIKLAGRSGAFDLSEYGIPEERMPAFDHITGLAIAVGLHALRDAGIPLVMRYKETSTGSRLPERWCLPDELRDDTGVIFASAFPTLDPILNETRAYYDHRGLLGRIEELEFISKRLRAVNGQSQAAQDEIERQLESLRRREDQARYQLDRQFLFRVLSMGHSQFAEFIGARGPNTQINSACASTSFAIATANDWIQAGRCRRVVIISADDVTTDNTLEWIAGGFLASGAAATDELVEDAALPFDKRRHGMIVGMGAAALVVETNEAVKERGIVPICDVLATEMANSAFHGTRLDLDHMCQVMESLISKAEKRWRIDRHQIAGSTVFVSHETYTPARGGSAQAEVNALRYVFGESANKIVIANTKGFTGHAMATGIEEVVAVKTLETGIVPPVANIREIDPDLGKLNLSVGGLYPVEYTLRLGAGFGSQISMSLFRHRPAPDGQRRNPSNLGFEYRIEDKQSWKRWLSSVSEHADPEIEIAHHTLRIRDDFATGSSVRSGLTTKETSPLPSEPATATSAATTQPATTSQPIDDTGSRVEASVLKIVSEITGYPADMLDPELDMEADLGIDTVKQAETFAAIREHFEIERDDTVQLRDFPSLAHVIDFVFDKRPDLKESDQIVSEIPSSSDSSSDDVTASVLVVVAGVTGYPVDMLDVDLDMEADLGIDTVKQAETFSAIRERFGIERDDTVQLRDFPTLKHVVGFVLAARPELAVAQAAQHSSTYTVQNETQIVTATTSGSAVRSGSIEKKVLSIVATVTGYPEDMLDLELDMEADLGIDTVKQAETFSSVREAFDIPRDDALELRAFATLGDVVQFVRDRVPVAEDEDPTSADEAKSSVPTSTPMQFSAAGVAERVLAIASKVTGYPAEMLEMDLDLEADLGIDTVKQAEMFAAIRHAYGIERDDTLQLREFPTLADVVQFALDRGSMSDGSATVGTIGGEPEVAEETSESPHRSSSNDSVEQKVLDIVGEQTGYPPEMLDLELDLEADLGIDTVKQAEMFAAVRAAYGIPRDDNMQLRDFPTLADVIQFARDKMPDSDFQQAKDESMNPGLTVTEMSSSVPVSSTIPRRIPVARWRPPAAAFDKSGITIDKTARIVIMPDSSGIGKSLEERLTKRGASVLMLDRDAKPDELESTLVAFAEKGLTGMYWLPSLDFEGELSEMEPTVWKTAVDLRVKFLFRALKSVYDSFRETDCFLVSASRLGGKHGYDEKGAFAPLGGATIGLTKAFKREQPHVLVKAVDFAPSRKTAAIADRLIDETLWDKGIVEVGYQDDNRFGVGLEQAELSSEDPVLPLRSDSVFVITGAAGSIVSEIITDLASHSGGTFHLLDLAPEPNPLDPDISLFRSDKDRLKRVLFERLKASGEKATPALIDRMIAELERKNAALLAIEAIKNAGGTVHYHQVNMLDLDAVGKAIDIVREESGRIDVVVHAAGLEISRWIPDKSIEEYDLVFDVKATGWYNLIHSIGTMPLGATVAFSSIAGRFGNGGQSDYSAANDMLCKYASHFRDERFQARGIAIDWTAWGDVGMATRGSIPKMMELAGIDMLPLVEGRPIVRRELTQHTDSCEIVVAGSLGAMIEPFEPGSGLNLTDQTGLFAHGDARVDVNGEIVLEMDLDPTEQPFLFDHQIGGTPVLPGVMGLEAFAEAATFVCTGMHVVEISDVRFLAPFKFYKNQSRKVVLRYAVESEGDDLVAHVRLLGYRDLPTSPGPVETVHFTGRVRLSANPRDSNGSFDIPKVAGPVLERDDVYKLYFHGPAYQVLDTVWSANDRIAARGSSSLPDNHSPASASLTIQPRSVELLFQTAGIKEMAETSRMGLPSAIGSLRIHRKLDNFHELLDEDVYAIVWNEENEGGFHGLVVNQEGNPLLELSHYKTAQLPDSPDATLLAPVKNLLAVTE